MKLCLSPRASTVALVVSAGLFAFSANVTSAADLITPTKTSDTVKVVSQDGKTYLCPGSAFDASGKADVSKCTNAPGTPPASGESVKIVTVDTKQYYCPLTAFDASSGKVDISLCTAIVATTTPPTTTGSTSTKIIEVDGKKYECPLSAIDASGKADLTKCKAVTDTSSGTSTGTNKIIDVNGKKYECPPSAFDASTGRVDLTQCKAVTATPTTTGTGSTEAKTVEVDGKKYICPLSAFDATTGKPDLTKCKLADATTSTNTGSTQPRIVETKDGKFACPADAFANGAVDTSKCKALNSTESNDDSNKSSVVCLPASGATQVTLTDSTVTTTGTTSTTSTTTSGSSTAPKCVQPSKVQENNPLGKIATKCPGGGTRDVSGGYDSKTGVLDITINIKDCVDRNGAKHTGTATMQGTVLPKTGSDGVYTMQETKTILTTVVAPSGSTYKRSCTLTRDGEYDSKKNTFNGKSTRDNCTLDGEYRFRDTFVDNLVDNATSSEDF